MDQGMHGLGERSPVYRSPFHQMKVQGDLHVGEGDDVAVDDREDPIGECGGGLYEKR
jgi:hypothetical protein